MAQIINIPEDEDYEFDVFDYLDMADNARTKKQKLEYTEKALELEPKNIDALMMKAELTSKDDLTRLKEFESIVEFARAELEKDNYFKDCVGDFWGLTETRPYMRARYELIKCYIDLGMMKLARQNCEEMLELCECDNLGLRYTLMHIYAFFEDEDALLKLYEKYEEDSSMVLFPLSVLYYKKLDLETASKYLEQLRQSNKEFKDIVHFLRNENMFKMVISDMDLNSYELGTAEEILAEVEENYFLFRQTPGYFDWVNKELRKKKGRKG